MFSNNELDSISARELKILSNNFHCPIIYRIYERGRISKFEGFAKRRRKLDSSIVKNEKKWWKIVCGCNSSRGNKSAQIKA